MPENNSEIVKIFPEVKTTLLTKIAEIWQNFLEQVPLLIIGVIVLMVTLLVAKLLRKTILKVLMKSKIRYSLKQLIIRFASVLIWIFGLLITAMIIFPDLTPTKALGGLGLLSVAVGFAFKDIFENFFAGVIILWRFPFENGDFIEVGDIVGEVVDTSIRVTLIRKTNNELIIVPNSMLVKNPVKVLTNQNNRRFKAIVGIAYGEDIEKSCEIIKQALQKCDLILQEHGFQIFAKEFNSSSVDIEVCWWAKSTPYGNRSSRSQALTEIKKAFDREGIEIPFPYRTLVFKDSVKIEN